MKVLVVRPDKSLDTIEFTAIASVHEGEHLNRVTTSGGVDHYFNHDGTYDGWGMGVACDSREGGVK